MQWFDDDDINKYLGKRDYDIKKSRNARWFDQKCTPDVLTIVADCILEYTSNNKDQEYFTSKNIQLNGYTINNVKALFKKPETDDPLASSEYDKYFQQPMELLSYAGILEKDPNSPHYNYYKVKNIDLLQFLAIREMNSLKFIYLYIQKVLKDSGIYSPFERFLATQDLNSYSEAKRAFADFTIGNTPINKKKECNRIFTKIINPMAFFRNAKGTERGTISRDVITRDELMYNRDNFRDIYANKPKSITRQEWLRNISYKPNRDLIAYQTAKAKKLLRIYNDQFCDSKSEVVDDYSTGPAVHVHHIFPANEFEGISGYVENLIALTPSQHLIEAHPNGDTRHINKDFQQICLIAKTDSIKKNLEEDKDVIYSFSNYTYVLSVGFDNKKYDDIEDGDYDEILRMINAEYIEK